MAAEYKHGGKESFTYKGHSCHLNPVEEESENSPHQCREADSIDSESGRRHSVESMASQMSSCSSTEAEVSSQKPTTPDSFAHRRRVDQPMRQRARRNSADPNAGKQPMIDEYGFVVQTQYQLSSYVDKKETQSRLWSRLTGSMSASLPEKSSRVKEAVRCGIPAHFRKPAWFLYSGGAALMQASPVRTFQSLLDNMPRQLQAIMNQFDEDFPHLFPGNARFQLGQMMAPSNAFIEEPMRPPIYFSLKKVLSAILLRRPSLSYSVPLCSLAAFVLLVIDDPEKAFWTVASVLGSVLPADLFEDTITQIFVDRDAFASILQAKLPKLNEHLSRLDVPLSIIIGSWFQNVFINVLPPHCVRRVLDSLLYEGAKVLYRVALAIFRLNEHAIFSCQTATDVTALLRNLPRSIQDPFELMATAFDRVGSLPWRQIEHAREAARRKMEAMRSVRKFSVGVRRMSLASRLPPPQH